MVQVSVAVIVVVDVCTFGLLKILLVGLWEKKVVQLGEAGSRDCRVHDQRVSFCVAQEIFSNDSGRRPNILAGHTAVLCFG